MNEQNNKSCPAWNPNCYFTRAIDAVNKLAIDYLDSVEDHESRKRINDMMATLTSVKEMVIDKNRGKKLELRRNKIRIGK